MRSVVVACFYFFYNNRTLNNCAELQNSWKLHRNLGQFSSGGGTLTFFATVFQASKHLLLAGNVL